MDKKRDRSRSQFVCTRQLCAKFAVAICLAGCGERSQELEERVTQLQKELNRTQDELRSTKQAFNATSEELARLKAVSNSVSPTPAAPAAVVQVTPDPAASTSGNSPASGQRPVVNSMPADRSVTIRWPGGGNESVPASQNAPAPVRRNAAEIVPQQSGASGPGGASNRTVVIQWPNNSGAPPPTNQQAPPSSAANPPAGAVQPPPSGAANPPAGAVQPPPSGAANPPAHVVQPPPSGATGRSDRTVIIQWPDSKQSPPPRN